jgi:O-antigen/teichoic acid export membrane protein
VGGPSGSIVVFIAIADCTSGQLGSCTSQVFPTFEKMRITATLGFPTRPLRLLLAAGMLIVLHHATARDWAIASLTISLIATIAGIVAATVQCGWPEVVPRLLLECIGERFIVTVFGSTTSAYNDIDKETLGHYGMSVASGTYSIVYRVINICAMPITSIYGARSRGFFAKGPH